MNENIRQLAAALPTSLRDQVTSYVAAVHEASPAIFRDAGVPVDHTMLDQLLVIAAIRKIFGIIATSFWAVDNSLRIDRSASHESVRIGGSVYRPGSESYEGLKDLFRGIETMLAEQGMMRLVQARNYSEVLQELALGPRQS